MPITVRTPTSSVADLAGGFTADPGSTPHEAVQKQDSAGADKSAIATHSLPASLLATVFGDFGFFLAAKAGTLDSGPALLDPAVLSPGGAWAAVDDGSGSAKPLAVIRARKSDATGDESFGGRFVVASNETSSKAHGALTAAFAAYSHRDTSASAAFTTRPEFGDGPTRIQHKLNSLRTAGLASYFTYVDSLTAQVAWVIRYDRRGGGSADGAGGGGRTQLASRRGGAAGAGAAGGRITVEKKLVGGGRAEGATGGRRTQVVGRPGGGRAEADAGGRASPAVNRKGGASGQGTISGVERLYTFAVSGVTRNAQGAPVPGCRVDLFRTSTNGLLATQTSDGAGAFRFPLTSQPITYWMRSHKAGTPNVFATTDEDLVVAEELVQGPPVP